MSEEAAATEVPTSGTEEAIEQEGDGSNIFSLNRPKDIRDGLSGGMANILKGTIGGAAILVGAPIKGAYDGSQEGVWGGIKGFGVGLGMGLVGGAMMAGGGVVTGAIQVGRGLYNTPESISASTQGKDWDVETRTWIIYDLSKEADIYLNMTDEQFLQSKKARGEDVQDPTTPSEAPVRPAKKVADMQYYDVLGVPSNATAGEIKKAYYKEARKNHPDKHPDDPSAQANFQKIGQAYQILSDETTRKSYDEGGQDSVEGAAKMDSATMFAMIFGSEKFVPLVGELKLSSQMQAKEDIQDSRLDAFHQRKREVQCAANLADKLRPYMDFDGNDELYKASYQEEVMELSSTPFGSTLLNTIGRAYREHALSELGTWDGLKVGAGQTARSITSSLHIAKEGIQAAYVANQISKEQKKLESKDGNAEGKEVDGSGSGDKDGEKNGTDGTDNTARTDEGKSTEDAGKEEEVQKRIEQMSGHMFTVMWHLTAMDIRSTLASVCRKVTHDHSVDENTRLQRAKAMLSLGDLFMAHGVSSKEGLKDLKSRMGSQFGGGGRAGGEGGKEGEGEEEDVTNLGGGADQSM